MKFPFLHMAFLGLSLLTLIAGCSTTPQAQVSPVPHPVPAPATIPASAPDTPLLPLLLSREEIPFAVANEKNQFPDLQEPSLSRFSAIRGFTRYVISEKTESQTSVQLGQMIVEYPPGNATPAFAEFVQKNKIADQSQYKITWLQDPGIGDESCALVIINSAGSSKPMAMIVFRKSNYMESVIMIGPSLDTETLTRTARAAADKIPV